VLNFGSSNLPSKFKREIKATSNPSKKFAQNTKGSASCCAVKRTSQAGSIRINFSVADVFIPSQERDAHVMLLHPISPIGISAEHLSNASSSIKISGKEYVE
jgi:hypothetical protein